jgi:predicted MPP superfamily phosphohydrolase
MRRYAEMGMTVLKNSWVAIKRNGASLVIGAVTDPWARRFGREEPDPVKAFAGAPEEGPRILLSHQPKYAKKFEQAVRFDVQLSGHTHGGQIRGMDEAVSILNGTFVRGWYRLSHSLLYVHSGSGLWNGFPIRLGVPSEIAFFTLRRLK